MLSEDTGCLQMTALENLASNVLRNGKWVWESDLRPQLDGKQLLDRTGYLSRMYGVVGW